MSVPASRLPASRGAISEIVGLAPAPPAIGSVTFPAAAQAKTDLTVGLAGLAQETLDPPVAGHFVNYYLSLMYDYLVGTTIDGYGWPFSPTCSDQTRIASSRIP
jgi:hypothetical protein